MTADRALAWDVEFGLVELSVIELAPAWMHEMRDPHSGEWIRSIPDSHMFEGDKPDKPGEGVHRYVVPPHSRLIAKSGHKDPGDHPFWKRFPVSPENIISAYDAADEGTKAQGRTWYEDSHHLAGTYIAPGNAELGGILLSTYSPRKVWPENMYQAARSARTGKAMGPKDGMMITGQMQAKAQRAIDGAGISELMKTAKTHSFGRLIAMGDDHPDDPYGHVVIDTHAVNVAAGGVIRGKEGEDAPIGDARQHEYVADQYREAARRISEREGKVMKPHQLQAITWLVQKQVNEARDAAAGAALDKGRISMTKNSWKRWMDYAKTHQIPLVTGTTAPAETLANALLDPDSISAQLLLSAEPRPFQGTR